MKKALIISGGEYSPIEISEDYEYIIACDKGTEYARRMNIVPSIIIGDFDSLDSDPAKLFRSVPIAKFSVHKDDTDTMLAIKHALSKGYKHITIICALGNRLDHTLANIQGLGYIASKGAIGEIISSREYLRTLSGYEKSLTLNANFDRSLSILALTDKCEGIAIKGAEYEVSEVTLSNNFPLGFGNHFVEDTVTVSIESGTLLIIESVLEK